MLEKQGNNQCTSSSGPIFNGLNKPHLPIEEHPDESTPSQPKPPAETEKHSPGCSARTTAGGQTSSCPPLSRNECSEFGLAGGDENCFIDEIVKEHTDIGAAEINVYRLLGVHEQGRLVDCTGRGKGISGGFLGDFTADNAFTKFDTKWQSIQRGPGVLASGFIGYDFGEIPINTLARNAYGRETYVMKHINAISIKQSNNQKERVTEARIERSFDGIKWYGVDRVIFPDDDCLNTVFFTDSVPSRFWRIRPIKFNGGPNNRWSVSAIEMFHNYVATEFHNIQDKVFLENRDRDYETQPQNMKGYYDLYDSTTELGKFGIELPSQTIYLTVSFSRCVELFGRPIVIGDIIEIPSEAMYSSKLRRIEKWLEVIDVAWSTEGYTPGWNPTMLRLILQPAMASQETQDIFGDLATYEVENGLGLVDQETGKDPAFQDYFDATQTAFAEARDDVPQRGTEASSTIRAWEESEIKNSEKTVYDSNGRVLQKGIINLQKIGLNPNGPYVEDGMPPNNADYTEGDDWPQNPTHGDYHRLTYSKISSQIPARLYRYSKVKGRWLFLEVDRRKQFDRTVPMLQEFAEDPRAREGDEIVRGEPKWRERIRKSCEILPHTTTKNDVPPETKDNTKDFKVTTRTRANNTLKPMEVGNDNEIGNGNKSPSCPEKKT